MTKFSHLCQQTKALRSLQAINLNIDTRTSSVSWIADVVELLSYSPLETFHISSLAGEMGIDLPDAFCAAIVDAHYSSLRRFSVNRMRLSLSAIRDICSRCHDLERLFVVLQHENLVCRVQILCLRSALIPLFVQEELGSCLSLATNLRAFHATRSLGLESEEALVVPDPKILSLVRQCGWKLSQVGFYTRVKQVCGPLLPLWVSNTFVRMEPHTGGTSSISGFARRTLRRTASCVVREPRNAGAIPRRTYLVDHGITNSRLLRP